MNGINMGQKIKKIRTKKKITQKELASLIGKSERMIQKYESGNVVPSIDIINNIAKVLEVSEKELFLSIDEVETFANKLLIEELQNKYNTLQDDFDKLIEENKMLKDLVKFQSEKIAKLEGEIND